MITKKSILAALKKDIAIINKQKKKTEEYIAYGCGQFLNVGNDQWSGNHEEVLRLFDDMLKWANKLTVKLDKLKSDPKPTPVSDIVIKGSNLRLGVSETDLSQGCIDYIYSSYENAFDGGESLVFLDDTNVNPLDSCHHTLFPNLSKLFKEVEQVD